MGATRHARVAVAALAALSAAIAAAGPKGSALAGSPAQQPQAVFRSQVDAVRVDVLVTRDGAPVTGLRAADFELRDSGVPQRIADTSFEQVPIEALLALDVSGSITLENARLLRSAAAAFLEGLAPADQVGLVTFHHRVVLAQEPTTDAGLILRRIDVLERGGSTALNDGIYAALRLRTPNVSRGAVVVFTDGIDNTSWLSREEVEHTARRADAIVHAVVVDFPESRLRAADNPLLHALAADTGGRVWEATWGPSLVEAFRAVLRDLRSRYVLTYYPEGVAAEGWHPLEVRLRRGGGKVTARTGYFRHAAGR